MTPKTFYVYVDHRGDDKVPFYVGKGTARRVRDYTRRSIVWKSIASVHGVERRIVIETQDEQLASIKEAELIFELKTRDYFGGANLDDGGKGPKGYKHTVDLRSRLSAYSKRRMSTPEERAAASEKFSKLWIDQRDSMLESHPRGESHHRAKLKESDVIQMRRDYDALDGSRGSTSRFVREWSQKLGVTEENVFRVIMRKSWRHIA